MQIASSVASYLLLHQKMGLSSIGTLILKKFRGFLETETKTLYPPMVHVIFEETETLDTNFAQYISAQHLINLQQAQLQLDSWLLNIKAELINGNTFIIENIGSFKLQNQKIQFTSFDDDYFNQASFGLKPLQNIILLDDALLNESTEEQIIIQQNLEPKIETELEVEILRETAAELKVEAEITPTQMVNKPIDEPILKTPKPEPNKINTPQNTPKQKKDWFWIIAIILVCLTGAIVCATFVFFPPFKAIEIPLKFDNTETDTAAAVTNQPDTTITYEIIVAENLTPLKAQKQLLKLKAMGIYGHLITNDSNIILQISVAKFLQLDSAQTKLKQIQNSNYPKAYLKTTTEIN
ncbi:MAG: hypothetical protein EAZ15_06970 [Sphingobacteriales bacterium]|nr:MAG: hypothetical protein EAZ15_06970 [Sphingobacteriales bacterium]